MHFYSLGISKSLESKTGRENESQRLSLFFPPIQRSLKSNPYDSERVFLCKSTRTWLIPLYNSVPFFHHNDAYFSPITLFLPKNRKCQGKNFIRLISTLLHLNSTYINGAAFFLFLSPSFAACSKWG